VLFSVFTSSTIHFYSFFSFTAFLSIKSKKAFGKIHPFKIFFFLISTYLNFLNITPVFMILPNYFCKAMLLRISMYKQKD